MMFLSDFNGLLINKSQRVINRIELPMLQGRAVHVTQQLLATTTSALKTFDLPVAIRTCQFFGTNTKIHVVCHTFQIPCSRQNKTFFQGSFPKSQDMTSELRQRQCVQIFNTENKTKTSKTSQDFRPNLKTIQPCC